MLETSSPGLQCLAFTRLIRRGEAAQDHFHLLVEPGHESGVTWSDPVSKPLDRAAVPAPEHGDTLETQVTRTAWAALAPGIDTEWNNVRTRRLMRTSEAFNNSQSDVVRLQGGKSTVITKSPGNTDFTTTTARRRRGGRRGAVLPVKLINE